MVIDRMVIHHPQATLAIWLRKHLAGYSDRFCQAHILLGLQCITRFFLHRAPSLLSEVCRLHSPFQRLISLLLATCQRQVIKADVHEIYTISVKEDFIHLRLTLMLTGWVLLIVAALDLLLVLE